MKPHQERVIVESRDLDAKIIALTEFLDGPIMLTLPVHEQERLRYQNMAMRLYSRILSDRIAAFE